MITRNWEQEIESRASWIRDYVQSSGAKGVVLGLSGGKDSTTVAGLCQRAKIETLGVVLPCGGVSSDRDHGVLAAETFSIPYVEVNLKDAFDAMLGTLKAQSHTELTDIAIANIKPRLRMIALYTIAQSRNALVIGTDNRSEALMGYFTKWGDGAYDFNPLGDLTVTEVFALGRALNAPAEILDKAPSAGLWEGQTDESEMGVTYAAIDQYLLDGTGSKKDIEIIQQAEKRSRHKLHMPVAYPNR